MTFTFRPAVRENVGLLIGLIGPSGGGKTYTAMRLASGISGDQPFAVIDTEAGRAKHYADRFRFDHGDLTPPFRPDRYLEAIRAADQAKYPAIVVDSFSHEHAGDGGLLDWHEEELERMTKGNDARRDALTMAAWIKPKMAHKAMVQALLQVRAHLILCFRAEEKIEMVKNKETGKLEIVPKRTLAGFSGWIPICEKSLPYELTVSLLLTPDQPGVPHPIKLQEQHRPLFPLDQPITEESGRQLAAWAKGGEAHHDVQPVRRIPCERPMSGENSVTGGGASGSNTPNGTERDTLIGKISGLADRMRMPTPTRQRLAKKHLGEATLATADVAALQDLYDAMQAEEEKPA